MFQLLKSSRQRGASTDTSHGHYASEGELEAVLVALCDSLYPSGNGKEDRVAPAKFKQIATMLQELDRRHSRYGPACWHHRPRVYAVLHRIDALSCMDNFISREFTDIYLPFDWQTLGNVCGNDERKQAFLLRQKDVLTRARFLEALDSNEHLSFIGSANDHFLIIRPFASSRPGTSVDLVQSKLSRELYARKVFRRRFDNAEARRAQSEFIQEISLLKRLEHQHLVTIWGSYTDERHMAYLMRPVADCNLSGYLEAFDRRDSATLRQFFGCLAGGVSYLHSQNIRHRDLKPQNVLIAGGPLGPTVYISDFGSALDHSTSMRPTTLDRCVPASSGYTPPEVLNHEERSVKSDMWSLGVVFLEMVAALKGRTFSEWTHHLSRKGNKEREPARNWPAISEWIEILRQSHNSDIKDNEPLAWVQELLLLRRDNRPSSSSLIHEISQSAYALDFLCEDCHIGLCDPSTVVLDSRPRGESEDDALGRLVVNRQVEALTSTAPEPPEPAMTPERSNSIQSWLRTTSQSSEGLKIEGSSDQETLGLPIFAEPVDFTLIEQLSYQKRTENGSNEDVEELGFGIVKDDSGSSTQSDFDGNPFRIRIDSDSEDSLEPTEDELDNMRNDYPMMDNSLSLKDILEEDEDAASTELVIGQESERCPDFMSVSNRSLHSQTDAASSQLGNVGETTAESNINAGKSSQTSSTSQKSNVTARQPGVEADSEQYQRPTIQSNTRTSNRHDSSETMLGEEKRVKTPYSEQRTSPSNKVGGINKSTSSKQKIERNNSTTRDVRSQPIAETSVGTSRHQPQKSVSSSEPIDVSWIERAGKDAMDSERQRSTSTTKEAVGSGKEPISSTEKTAAEGERQNVSGRVDIATRTADIKNDKAKVGSENPSSERKDKTLEASKKPSPSKSPKDTPKESQLLGLADPTGGRSSFKPSKDMQRGNQMADRTDSSEKQGQIPAKKDSLETPLSSKKPKDSQRRLESSESRSTSKSLKDIHDKNESEDSHRGHHEPRTKGSLLSEKNVKKLNEEIPAPEKIQPKQWSGFNADAFDATNYLEQIWTDLHGAKSIATSQASELTLQRLRGSGNPYMDRSLHLLEEYCTKGKSSAVKALLQNGCNPGTASRPRPGPLIRAIKGHSERHNKCVRALISKGCDVNVSYKGKTPIHLAIENPWFKGYEKLIALLLAAGADANVADADRDYPLLKILSGDADTPLQEREMNALALFLHKTVSIFVNVDVRKPGSLNTALHLAVRRRSPQAVAVLIHRGADANATNGSGIPPLLMAASQWRGIMDLEQEMVLSYLLASPVLQIDVKGGSLERTALHHAVAAKCSKAVGMLVSKGADPMAKDKRDLDAFALLESEKSGMEIEVYSVLREALEGSPPS